LLSLAIPGVYSKPSLGKLSATSFGGMKDLPNADFCSYE
jgi:hypothetical protein